MLLAAHAPICSKRAYEPGGCAEGGTSGLDNCRSGVEEAVGNFLPEVRAPDAEMVPSSTVGHDDPVLAIEGAPAASKAQLVGPLHAYVTASGSAPACRVAGVGADVEVPGFGNNGPAVVEAPLGGDVCPVGVGA